MKYFSEDEQYINAECENCKKILKIKRQNCIPVANGGFKLDPPMRCFCNNVSDVIIAKPVIKPSATLGPVMSNTNKSSTPPWIRFIIALFIAGIFIKACEDKTPKNVQESKPEKSTWEQNQDLARELDRMEKARQLDRMEEERRAVDKYREYK